MAVTDYPVGHELAISHWAKDLMKEALSRTQFLKFTGKSSNSLCQYKTEMKSVGDNVTFGLRMQLAGGGVVGDDTLEGNEESLVTYSDQIFIDQLRHAVRSKGKMSEQRVPFSVREEARDGLADWWADRMDTAFFNQLCGNNYTTAGAQTKFTGMNTCTDPIAAGDTDHIFYPDGRTTELTVASASASGIMSLDLIDNVCAQAKLIDPLIRPLKMNGEDRFVMFLHPNQVVDLRTNTNTGQWLDIQKAAMNGGNVTKNPIFTGALGMYNGVILHESTRIPTANATPSGGSLRRAVFAGAQSMCWAFGKGDTPGKFSWVESLFDYKNQLGVAAGSKWGLKKTRFNSKDFATILVPTYCTRADL